MPIGPKGSAFAVPMIRAADVVTPTVQATVDATFVDVAGSTIDALYFQSVSFTVVNTGAQTIKWKVLGANASDFSDVVEVQGSATIVAGASGSYSTAAAVWRYYKVQVADNVAASHGAATLRGVAK